MNFLKIIILLCVMVAACGDAEVAPPRLDELPDESSMIPPKCAQYVLWEIDTENGVAYDAAIEEACADHQALTGQSSAFIEGALFAAVPIFWFDSDLDHMIEIKKAGPTTRIGLAYIDRESVYIAMRRLLEDADD